MPDNARLLAGRYRLESVLGGGGMGQVWRARDDVLGRAVAVKEVIFPPGISDHDRDVLCDRTLREARFTASLNHPGIITTYDVVSEDGRPFIVMELLEVPSLADEIEQHGSLPPQRVAEIGLHLLAALQTAHRAGIVHRDVKPSNVLLGDGDRVVLTDFGIATSETDPSLTSTGMLIGSPTYMSPERLRGEVIGTPADLWSLGATLYAALQGHPPFRADTTMGTITAVLSEDVPLPQVRGPLRTALLGMLEKAPAQRMTLDQVQPLLQRAQQDRTMVMAAPATEADTADVRGVPPVLDREAAYEASAYQEPPVAHRPRRRLGPLVLAAGAVLAAVLAAAALANMLFGGQDGTPGGEPRAIQSRTTDSADRQDTEPPAQRDNQETRTPQAEDEPTDNPEPTEQTQEETEQETAEETEQETEEEPAGTVPAGYQLHQDPLGFEVAVPEGWERRLDSPTRVDFVSPDGSQFLRIDQRAQALPDAEEAWLEQEPAVADLLAGYERIRIEPVDYRDWGAADWEFTWEADNGTVHVLNRGIATDTRGFAVYVSAPDEVWDTEGMELFETATATFQPT